MSFQPVVPSGGLTGWRFLQRTYDTQFDAFNRSPVLDRDIDHFMEQIGSVRSASDLVGDRRLLTVALGAFGLQDDINNRFFIQKILEDGTGDREALANKLADRRYKQLSEAFGFGPGESRTTKDTAAMADLAQLYRTQEFEVSVGEQDDDMRIALYAQRELDRLARGPESEETKWYSLLGLPPLRRLFETALGLPSSFGQVDIEKQMQIFRDKTRGVTGSDAVAQFSDPELRKQMTERFLARAQIASVNVAISSQATALTLLRGF